MDFRLSGAGAALWLAACAGVPTETAPPDAAAAPVAQATAAGDEPVCRSEQLTGTHVSRTICRSRAEIERERAAATREMERMQRVQNPVGGD
jgi:hypothetical protein